MKKNKNPKKDLKEVRYSKLVPPNTKIGLRINPGHDLGISPSLSSSPPSICILLTSLPSHLTLLSPLSSLCFLFYPGISPDLKYTEKFGFSMDQFDDVLTEVAERGLVIDSLHFHSGWNYPEKVLPSFETVSIFFFFFYFFPFYFFFSFSFYLFFII